MAKHREFKEKRGFQKWMKDVKTEECPKCGAKYKDTEKQCPNCGESNEDYIKKHFVR